MSPASKIRDRPRRTVTFVVLAVLLVPTVMATADNLQWEAEGGRFIVPMPREGERVVYDLVLDDPAAGIDAVLPAAFEIAVGRVGSFERLDGTVVEAVAVTATMRTSMDDGLRAAHPWWPAESHMLLPQARSEDGLPMEGAVAWTSWYAVDDGRLVGAERQGSLHFYRISPQDSTDEVWRDQTVRVATEGAQYGVLATLRAQPGMRVVEGDDRIADAFLDDGGRLHASRRGMSEGRPMFDVAEPVRRTSFGMQDTTAISCTLLTGRFYAGVPTTVPGRPELARTAVEERAYWMHAESVFPVMDGCTTRVEDSTGTVLFAGHVELHRAHHEPGGRPLGLGASGAVPVAPTLAPASTVVPGLPATGRDGFPFPSEEALQAVYASEDTQVRAHLADATPRVHVASATFDMRGVDETATNRLPAPDALREVLDETRSGTQVALIAVWTVELVDCEGDVLPVEVRRQLAADGTKIQDEVRVIGDVFHAFHPANLPRFPSSMPTVAALETSIGAALADREVDPDRLETRTYRSFVTHDDQDPGNRTDILDASVSARYNGWAGIVEQVFDADGTPRYGSDTETRIVTGSPPAEQDPEYATTATAAAPEPVLHAADVAVLSGVLTFLALVLAYLWDTLRFHATRFLMVGLYAKIRRDKVLDSDRREGLLAAIAADPAVGTKELQDRLDMGWGTLVHHLAVLERNGFVYAVHEGRTRHWFVAGGEDVHEAKARAVLRSKALRAVVANLVETEADTASLAQDLALDASTVRAHLRRLARRGLVEPVGRGGAPRWRATRLGVRVLGSGQ